MVSHHGGSKNVDAVKDNLKALMDLGFAADDVRVRTSRSVPRLRCFVYMQTLRCKTGRTVSQYIANPSNPICFQ